MGRNELGFRQLLARRLTDPRSELLQRRIGGLLLGVRPIDEQQ
jgi:hypothetical protein